MTSRLYEALGPKISVTGVSSRPGSGISVWYPSCDPHRRGHVVGDPGVGQVAHPPRHPPEAPDVRGRVPHVRQLAREVGGPRPGRRHARGQVAEEQGQLPGRRMGGEPPEPPPRGCRPGPDDSEPPEPAPGDPGPADPGSDDSGPADPGPAGAGSPRAVSSRAVLPCPAMSAGCAVSADRSASPGGAASDGCAALPRLAGAADDCIALRPGNSGTRGSWPARSISSPRPASRPPGQFSLARAAAGRRYPAAPRDHFACGDTK